MFERDAEVCLAISQIHAGELELSAPGRNGASVVLAELLKLTRAHERIAQIVIDGRPELGIFHLRGVNAVAPDHHGGHGQDGKNPDQGGTRGRRGAHALHEPADAVGQDVALKLMTLFRFHAAWLLSEWLARDALLPMQTQPSHCRERLYFT